ncbi:glycine betaine uptake BCCT transporter [Aneurinibacillus sp. REN35]|uniref:glycine betaine uptake BCCT transporter n=1 Tax=Aneurinibacillus sp. REN35 TaxID=3237286 RepID=UPI003528C599
MLKNDIKRASHNNVVFWASAAIVLLFVIAGVVAPGGFAKYASAIFDFTTINFGWFYLLSMVFFVGFCLFMAFSRYGKIKLGADHEKPEYSFFTWISMLFSAGFGAGLVFWGVAEPMTHFASPPFKGMEPQSAEAARTAMRYTFFNWGIHQWSVFAVVGLGLSYFQFRKKSNSLISSTLQPVMGKRKSYYLKNGINILAVIATITGVATSFGMSVLQINGGLKYVFSIPDHTWVQLLIITVLFVLYMTSSVTGLDKGIKVLSNINMGMALCLMLFVLFAGPTVFILNGFTLGIGDYIQHFIETSFYLTPYEGGTWVRDWTIFYWAWVIAWSPFVGSFVARVSKGRTIREFVMGVLIVPPFIGLVWIAIFGGTALHMDLFENTAIANAVSKDITSALFVMLNELPLSSLLSVVSIVLIAIFIVTSADSATFVLGMMTSKGNLNPSMLAKVIWGGLMAAISAVLIISSGLKGLQTASLVTALPFTFILIAMCISLVKSLRQEQHQQQLGGQSYSEYSKEEKKASSG